MLLIEGPNQKLREAILEQLRRDTTPGKLVFTHPAEYKHERNLKYYFKMLSGDDHVNLVYERLGVAASLPDAAHRYMIAMALKARGSMALICHLSTDLMGKALETLAGRIDGCLPYISCTENDDLGLVVEKVLDYWQLLVNNSLPAFNYFGIGGVFRNQTMIVSDVKTIPNTFAYVGTQQSNIVLHQACYNVMKEQHDAHLFYMTHFNKTHNKRSNAKLLREEIEIVRPARVIAMGSGAAAMLTQIKQGFQRTDHPQYWARRRADQLTTLQNIFTNGIT